MILTSLTSYITSHIIAVTSTLTDLATSHNIITLPVPAPSITDQFLQVTFPFSLKKQLSASLSAARLGVQASSPVPYSGREDAPVLSPEERRALEERAAAVRSDLDARRANIQELKRRLEKTHVTE